TAIGIDADTVSPARNPTYTVTAPNNTPNSIPNITVFAVNSASDCSAPTYGRNSPAFAVGLHDFDATLASRTGYNSAPAKLAFKPGKQQRTVAPTTPTCNTAPPFVRADPSSCPPSSRQGTVLTGP